MANIYVKSGGGTIGSGSYRGNWTASSTYALGDRVCGVATSDYWIFECTTAGTSAGTEPTWVKTAGSTTTDNTVTWTARIPSTWENATFTLAKAAANDAAGDTIYLSSTHSESSASAQTIPLAGTLANPVLVLSVTEDATPVLTAGATITTTGVSNIIIQGSAYLNGITFNVGTTSGSAANFTAANVDNNNQVYENCSINIVATSTSNRIAFGTSTSNAESSVQMKDCIFKFSNAAQGLQLNGNAQVTVIGGGIDPTSAQTTSPITVSMHQQDVKFTNFDLSRLASNATLVGTTGAQGKITFTNCKLPTSWTGTPAGTLSNAGMRVSLYNCDSGATNYRLWVATSAGSIREETTVVKTGGASDGTTNLSWKMTTIAAANELVNPLISDTMAVWIDSVGTSKTITVDILHDSTTALTDAEVWLEIDYLGSSATPLGTPASDKRATVLTTPTNQATSTATWTSTGMTNPNKQKLEVTFTPNMKGFVYARVNLAKASYIVYVDPEPVLA